MLRQAFSSLASLTRASTSAPSALSRSTPSSMLRPFGTLPPLLASASPAPSRTAIPAPKPESGITDPSSFLSSISSPPRRDLASDGQLLGALGDKWEDMWSVDGTKLKGAGVNIKNRRYVLWALEKYRQGLEPSQFVTAPKPRKKIRGWGPRVQKGIRVRGRRRHGEK